MITPRPDLHLRSERPRPDIPRWQWALAPIIGPLVRRRLEARFDARWERVEPLMASIRDCKTRESLESLLGPPRYGMDGHPYSTTSADGSDVTHPDTVEVYEKDGCLIELWFKDGRIWCVTAAPSPTGWEMVTGALKRHLVTACRTRERR